MNLVRNLQKLQLSSTLGNVLLKQKHHPQVDMARTTSFFVKLPAEQIWKGVTSVSNAGMKRGRGRGAAKKKGRDLNRGQVIGVGKINMVWPGLNAPVVRGRELVKREELPEDKEREAQLIKLRDSMGFKRMGRLSPIDRGWSGNKMPGRSIGAPDPIGDQTFEGFDTRVLELKTVFIMKRNIGRRRRLSVMAVTGNGNGVGGFSVAKAIDTKTALRKVKNRAGQKLMHVELCNGHTVFHDIFSQFGKTKIFIKRKPEGYGLVCQRAIKTICQVIGIKDLYAKIEGSRNPQHIVKAFFLGLLKQRTHQQLAEEKGLHVVEFRKDQGNFPTVVASPSRCRTEDEIPSSEILDFTQHGLDGKIVLKKKKYPPFYVGTHGHNKYLRKQENVRGHYETRIDMKVHYGELRSFLTDKYPECKPYVRPKKDEQQE
uniref:Small ribosomal subunit protein uS5m n=1 Tax=Lutzomyia longipalpis TaxID=7200 RepID=A0A7G3ARN3_LUTLO